MKRVLQLICLILCLSVFEAKSQNKVSDSVLHQLAVWMEGSFSNHEQAQQDTSYFDSQLHVKRIWNKRKNEYWFYMEQSVVNFTERPYRQKVLRLVRKNADTIECKMFEIQFAIRFAGEWKKDNPLSGLAPDSLQERIGCSIFLLWNKQSKSYDGTGKNNTCIGDLRAATYTTTDLTILSDTFIFWDRGWSTKGVVVWGIPNGGYKYKRTSKR